MPDNWVACITSAHQSPMGLIWYLQPPVTANSECSLLKWVSGEVCCAGSAVEDYRAGSYTYDNDSVTTNLYLGNINPKVWVHCIHWIVSILLCNLRLSFYILHNGITTNAVTFIRWLKLMLISYQLIRLIDTTINTCGQPVYDCIV